ncbi:hypothetical protein ACFWUW_23330 [Streptomyces sp. NPDC058655]|uniref:hypothetical protein n=1 Tax=Streptomyces sp. NPDC058655 TaxID=3346577 RepID=UPI003660E29A
MGLIPYNRVFDVLEHRFRLAELPFPVAAADGPARLSALAARRALYGRSGPGRRCKSPGSLSSCRRG